MRTLRSRISLAVLVVATLFTAVTTTRTAVAQGIDVTAQVDATEVELGDSIVYSMQATTSTGDSPSNPILATPQGFTVVDRSASPTHMVSIINGRASEKHGLTATWTLRSDRLGTFTIGPATITFGAIKKSAPAQRVTVVAPGTGRPKAPPRRQNGPRPFDPFGSGVDPFKGLFPGLDDDSAPDPIGSLSSDPKLSMPEPRASVAFLHATIDKTRAVVGEQVTLNVYLYEDIHARQGRPSDVHEATATDFVKRSLLQDETRAVFVGNANVGGRLWSVKQVRKNALFPIKTGRLAIAPMSLTLPQARVGLRESETLYVDVSEPPVAGRPAGYQIGDTGDFSLSASTTPHAVEQHGAVGVTVELRGSGNMPSSLPTPEIAGVEWLEPQTRDALGPVSAERFGGTRTFSYVVRIHKDGNVDLGEIRLPYFDPQTRSYSVARASLGIVQVTKSAGRDAGPEVADPVLPGLPKVRTALEGTREDTYIAERPLYWGALFGSPLACAAAIAFSGAVRRAREKRANAAPSPEKIARERTREAEAAMKSADGKAAALAVLRAIEAELIARTGVNIRGTSGSGTVRELEDAGVSAETAKAILEVVTQCEDARFSPSDIPMKQARDLWKRAKETLESVTPRAQSLPPSAGDEAS